MMDNSNMDVAASGIDQTPVDNNAQLNERTFKQSELNEIVGRAKHDAVESYKRQQSQQSTQQNYANTNPNTLSESDVRRLTTEELNKQREEWERQNQEKQHAEAAQRIVNAYRDKIAAGKDKYQDFESVTNTVDMRYYPNVVQLLADHVDNASDILYDLAKNRYKLNNLESLCERTPQDAIYEIRRLSDSIKANENGSHVRTPNEPLSQQRPSNTGVGSGALSIADYKRMYKG